MEVEAVGVELLIPPWRFIVHHHQLIQVSVCLEPANRGQGSTGGPGSRGQGGPRALGRVYKLLDLITTSRGQGVLLPLLLDRYEHDVLLPLTPYLSIKSNTPIQATGH